MTNEEIKQECESIYANLRTGQERLKAIRSECKHEKTFEGNWSWRTGSVEPAEICEFCGDCVKLLNVIALPIIKFNL